MEEINMKKTNEQEQQNGLHLSNIRVPYKRILNEEEFQT